MGMVTTTGWGISWFHVRMVLFTSSNFTLRIRQVVESSLKYSSKVRSLKATQTQNFFNKLSRFHLEAIQWWLSLNGMFPSYQQVCQREVTTFIPLTNNAVIIIIVNTVIQASFLLDFPPISPYLDGQDSTSIFEKWLTLTPTRQTQFRKEKIS